MKKLLFCLLFSSCVAVSPVKESSIVPTIPIDFPVKPNLTEYSRKPIIEKIDSDFKVSDEFVNNSVLLKKYTDKIDDWKAKNKLK